MFWFLFISVPILLVFLLAFWVWPLPRFIDPLADRVVSRAPAWSWPIITPLAVVFIQCLSRGRRGMASWVCAVGVGSGFLLGLLFWLAHRSRRKKIANGSIDQDL